jgi:hypothetical protein
MKRMLALTLLVTCAACAPAAAAKPPKKLVRWTYAVTVKGDAAYHHAAEQPVIGGALSTIEDLRFRWKAKLPRFQILHGQVLNSGIGKVKFAAVETKRSISMPDPLGGVATGECSGMTATSGPAALEDGLLAPLGKGEDMSLVLTPFRTVRAPFLCTGKLNGPGSLALQDSTEKGKTFEIPFDLPLEAVGHGKVIQLFDTDAYGCPAPPDPYTTACSFHMNGTITMRRVGKKVLGRLGKAPGR